VGLSSSVAHFVDVGARGKGPCEPVFDRPRRASKSPGSGHLHLWIDSDAGVDDIHAILVAIALVSGRASSSRPARLEGLSLVNGNISLEQGIVNVRRALRLFEGGEGVPVHFGAAEPIMGLATEPDGFFGSDGLGDVPALHPAVTEDLCWPEPTGGAAAAPGPWSHGAVKLVEKAHAMPGELVVVAIGPLTNLALASLLEPDLPSLIKEVHVMGGAVGPGNITSHSEYNFYFDAEAADVVVRKFHGLKLYTWDLAKRAVVPWGAWDRLAASSSPAARFATGIAQASIQRSGSRAGPGYVLCDPLCVAGAARPEMLRLSGPKVARVTVGGEEHGRLVVGDAPPDSGLPTIQIVEDVDMDSLVGLFEESLTQLVAPQGLQSFSP